MEAAGEYLKESLTLLCNALEQESNYHPNIRYLKVCDTQELKCINYRQRDDAVGDMRALNRFYRFPHQTFVLAANILDRFISSIRVLPRHLSYASLASFYLAVKSTVSKEEVPSPESIIRISQRWCNSQDLSNMEKLVESKLGGQLKNSVTSLTFVQIYHRILQKLGSSWMAGDCCQLEALCAKLQACLCSYSLTEFKPSVLSLALLHIELLSVTNSEEDRSKCLKSMSALHHISKVSASEYEACLSEVAKCLHSYSTCQSKRPQGHKLTWIISTRTARQLKFGSLMALCLPTIHEGTLYPSQYGDGLNSEGSSIDDTSSEDGNLHCPDLNT